MNHDELIERIQALEARWGAQADKASIFKQFIHDRDGYRAENVLCLAKASVLSYRDGKDVKAVLAREFGPDGDYGWIENPDTDTQAFWVTTRGSLFFVFRGTSGLKDVATDIKSNLVNININERPAGKAHAGFAGSVGSIWPEIASVVNSHPGTKVWFAGHSLGGALATLAAFVFTKHYDADRVGGLYTIGQPRVLGRGPERDAFEQALGDDRIFRVYKSMDPVPLVPWFGYKHVTGHRCYIKRNGRFIYRATLHDKYLDRAFKLVRTVRRMLIGAKLGELKSLVVDHRSQGYVDALVQSATVPSKTMRERLDSVWTLIQSVFRKDIRPVYFDMPSRATTRHITAAMEPSGPLPQFERRRAAH